MATSIRLIAQPSPGVFEFFRQRVGPPAKLFFGDDGIPFSAVGLIQGRLIDMIAAIDVAEKAADVKVFDLRGSCPQHIGLFGIFGNLSDVKASIEAIKEAKDLE